MSQDYLVFVFFDIYYNTCHKKMSPVGRSERSDLRHKRLHWISHVGSRYARSDLH